MNNLYVQEFTKQALDNGVPQQNIAALLNKASQIASRQTKTAAAPKLDIVDSLLKNAGMEKNASSISYVNGILNEAFMNGANVAQALQFTKTALDATNTKLAFMSKVNAIANDPRLSQYAEGFIGMAKQAGLSQDEAVSLLVDVVDREKQAHGSDDSTGMFKQPPDAGAGAPPSDPSAGAPPSPGGPSGPGSDPSQGAPGADAETAQIMQMLQSLPPEEQQQIIQSLLAAISGQGGGPSPAGAGPAGAPPGGPGAMPPMPAGPQGPS